MSSTAGALLLAVAGGPPQAHGSAGEQEKSIGSWFDLRCVDQVYASYKLTAATGSVVLCNYCN